MCKEIVYKNNYGNCISDDTEILTVSSARVQKTLTTNTANSFEIEFNYDETVNESLGKFDEHLCAYTASLIEKKLFEMLKKYNKKECSECVDVFVENEKIENDFINRKNSTVQCKKPCRSTVNIIKVTDKIVSLLVDHITYDDKNMHDSVLRTIMCNLYIEDLFTETNFDLHTAPRKTSQSLTHKEEFIYKVVYEYMKLKSNKIGSRISEEERGTYIRHTSKKGVHQAGQ